MSDQYWDDQLGDDTHQQYEYDDYDDGYDQGLFDEVLDTSPPPRPSGRLFTGLLIGGGAFVLAVAASVIALVFYIVPHQQAEQAAQQALQAAELAFTQASDSYTQAQTALQSAVATAQEIVANVTPDQVDDDTTLDALVSQVTPANALIVAVPAQAADTDAINQQTADLNNKTQAAQNATTTLNQAIDAVQKSRVDFAVSTLSTAIDDAQQIYNDSGWLGETKERGDLQAQLDAGNLAMGNPTSLGLNTDLVVSALQGVQKSVTSAAKAVTTAQTKATSATYTYTLKSSNGEISCGLNLCPSTAYVQYTLTTVKITVKKTAVTAVLTWLGGRTATFTGTRKADTAKVRQAGMGTNTVMWGTITFMDTYPNSAAIQFMGADSCQHYDGSSGTWFLNGCE